MTPDCLYQCLLAILSMLSWANGSVITAPPESAPRAPNLASITTDDPYNCDGQNIFFCPKAAGTCYSARDGYVGCCSVSKCAARTTCVPYTSGVSQTCDQDTGGCLLCTEPDKPKCATIVNLMEHQYIVFCNERQVQITTAYENVITTGSMADPPSSSTGTIPVATDTGNRLPISTTATKQTSISDDSSPTSTSIAPTSPDSGGVSPNILAAIIVSSVFALCTIAVIFFFFRRKRRASSNPETKAPPAGTNGGKPEASQAPAIPPSPIPGGPQTPEPTYVDPGSPGFVQTTYANDPNDYLSPIAAHKRAKLAEARDAREMQEIHELESAPVSGSTSEKSPTKQSITSNNSRADWWTPPVNPNGEGTPSVRWNQDADVMTHEVFPASLGEASANPASTSNSPSKQSIRSVPFQAELSENARAVDMNGVSPAMTDATFDPNAFVSPILGGDSFSTTPLMGLSSRPSVGELSAQATVEGPLEWPVVEGKGNNGLTSATGADCRYVSPEMAMANGYSAGGEDGGDEEEVRRSPLRQNVIA